MQQAEIIARNAEVDGLSRQIGYRAAMNNNKGLLSHHQMVTLLVNKQSEQVIKVPTNAITRSHLGNFVYKLEQDNQQN
jgi:membrane fusion protein (multidrug efflux system)